MPPHYYHRKRQRSAARLLPSVGHARPLSGREIDNKIKKWAGGWDKRVFHDELRFPNQPTYFYNEQNHRQLIKLVDIYHETSPEQVGRDRFLWSCFAQAVIKEHRRQLTLRQSKGSVPLYRCPKKYNLHRCFYVLLWISFHLRLPDRKVVEDILTEILSCCGNLRFMFSFLPGLSLRLYMQLLWSYQSSFKEKLCKEFFSLFNAHMVPQPFYREAYQLSRPMLLYLVQHLSPLHRDRMRASGPQTLSDIINKPILFGRKFSLLFIAIQHHDEELIRALLDRGASADKHLWDAFSGTSISAEKLMISSINAMMGSRQFLAGLLPESPQLTSPNMDAVSHYASLIRRSVLHSELRKSSNTWSGENSIYELNRQVADAWGIPCRKSFPSLQHLSKIRIRELILRADSCLVSTAAQQFPLPAKLIQYISLDLD